MLFRSKNTPVAPARGTISHKPKLGFPRIQNLTKVGNSSFRRYQERRNPTSGARSNTHVKTGRRDKALLKIPEFFHRRCHACAQSLPDSQQVDPQAGARWKEDTFMHDVKLSDRQEFAGSSRNPDRKNVLQRTKNTPVASVRGTISHKSKFGFL